MQKFCESFLINNGFVLRGVIVYGRNNIPIKDVKAFVEYDKEYPIFRIDLKKVLDKVSCNRWVAKCSVRRRLPDTIVIKVVERVPIAIWQYQYKHYLVDKDGRIFDIDGLTDKYGHLLHVVGKSANFYVYQLIQDMENNPTLLHEVKYAVIQGKRRWDLFIGDILVKMPEKRFDNAWRYLGQLYSEGVLNDKSIRVIDMRDENKFYVEKFNNVTLS
ncbi:cell division protein FtsQ/DivIB [Candidatus Sneabacter namystus]|uniref:FtsQ-type POTRA domain-containing protein n=1 Tax=Candidatus Sneabacter namystus TaxID=2601646 RepID=A0A5C0UHK3_9RICK|nr:cell division protein FtsQ/DivIB [Candidatus Sneabacter namystus]QEK39496.1 FtsQ-type POTRA domain-containing protein [Candidatus Sneabacter namystus]